MKVFKFGGGILHSPEAVKRMTGIIGMFQEEPLVIVVSAFGKTTNALEEVIAEAYRGGGEIRSLINKIADFHETILSGLFPDNAHPVYPETWNSWIRLTEMMESKNDLSYAEFYDQAICFGELVSSKIVSCYLTDQGFKNSFLDVRSILKTDSNFRQAAVNFEESQILADLYVSPILEADNIGQNLVVTQGFIGSDEEGRSTSLGREGSDYTASVFAYLLNASEVITWKDVPGILNADPKHFRQTIKLDQISYAEATELAYYGAKVIHPKTVKPLQNKGIPLQVRSFTDPEIPGTLISLDAETDISIPSFIFKFDQVLISVSTRDLSFINEKVFNDVFSLLDKYFIHMNILQNSALTLSFCVDDHPALPQLLEGLKERYSAKYNEGLELITIRHFNEKAAELVLTGKEVLLEQHNRTVVQYVVR